METRRALLVDAFTDEPLAGNVAGVLPDAAGLSDDRMGRVAAELGASETAFRFEAGDGADERLRYFTPSTEVDLCGHATIASYAALYAAGEIDAGERTLRTNVGDLSIRVDDDGTVWMRQNPPTVEAVDETELDADRLGDALGIDPAALRDVGADLPVAVASTGLPWLVVPVNFLERLGEAEPDAAAVEDISNAHDAAGIYAFTFDAIDAASTLHGRAFAPAVGVAEDPVTGTASGAVGAYLRSVDAFDGDFPDEIRFEQGHFVDRPGHVRVRVEGDEVRVGGRAVVSTEGELTLPAEREDDIIEA
ncbi:PhzF family phenazine biosynthesis protein [Halorubrum sp. Ib24]|uniref:PhzF family phenazine biosynthesis protein n=1 Tax=unclassified Halorubrum TaxID=2642239 RepID=UPI000B99B7D2|nr:MULTISPECIES: PhzF family phenazine biosynthesis protein [unclassified Halorubrum]OYR38805.1 PhzF family phenazine biosynthesis protein [Halorubrum sp. Ib24]OYR43756.1 PhzF family phenazine biosynthesis protein [Halorubrum sp. Eb13]